MLSEASTPGIYQSDLPNVTICSRSGPTEMIGIGTLR